MYEELGAASQQYNDRAMELSTLLARVTLHATPTSVSDPVHAQALAEHALTLSRDLDDQAAEARLLWSLSHVYRVTDRMPEAIASAERSLALARKLYLKEQMALALNDLGSHCYLMSRRIDQTRVTLAEPRALWRELANLLVLVDSLASIALVASMAGDYDQVLTFSEQAFQISQSTGNLWGQAFSRMQVGQAFWERGQTDKAIAAMEESIRVSESAGFGVPQVLTRASLAEVYGRLGAIERGLEIAHLALALTEASIPHSDLYVLAVLAQLHTLDGNLTEAEAFLEQAREDPNREVFPVIYVRRVLADCELALGQGRYDRAQVESDKLQTYMRRSGMRAYLPSALNLRGQALLTLGKLESDPDKAQILRKQAREVAEYMLDQTRAPELRASFLRLPHIRGVLED